MKFLALTLSICACFAQRPRAVEVTRQVSHGAFSPNISNVGRDVTITVFVSDCAIAGSISYGRGLGTDYQSMLRVFDSVDKTAEGALVPFPISTGPNWLSPTSGTSILPDGHPTVTLSSNPFWRVPDPSSVIVAGLLTTTAFHSSSPATERLLSYAGGLGTDSVALSKRLSASDPPSESLESHVIGSLTFRTVMSLTGSGLVPSYYGGADADPLKTLSSPARAIMGNFSGLEDFKSLHTGRISPVDVPSTAYNCITSLACLSKQGTTSLDLSTLVVNTETAFSATSIHTSLQTTSAFGWPGSAAGSSILYRASLGAEPELFDALIDIERLASRSGDTETDPFALLDLIADRAQVAIAKAKVGRI